MWQSATEIHAVQSCFVAEWLMMMMSESARTTTKEMISPVMSVHMFASVWCRILTPSEVISNLHAWMDIFQMNPKAICADMAFHHPHDRRAFYRLHNTNTLPTGPHTSCPNRADMGVRLFKKLLSALAETASKNLDRTSLA